MNTNAWTPTHETLDERCALRVCLASRDAIRMKSDPSCQYVSSTDSVPVATGAFNYSLYLFTVVFPPCFDLKVHHQGESLAISAGL